MTDTRKFRMHPDLLFSVIKAQAGTLAKALMELVMNSVDAGASRIEIMLDDKGFHVTDNGRGFTSFEEIESFFETFGTPHKEGDAVYGRFRIGRGQAFAFGRNVWRSGTFLMDVDIRGRGLDYTLVRDQEPQAGCTITGELYAPLLPGEIINTIRTLSENCLYCQIPLFINGKQVSILPASQKWDHQTDEAYIKVTQGRTLSVYNLGVLVGHFHSSEFGLGGTLVSKQQLTLNFARNDVLRGECKVWKKIKPVLTKISGDLNGRTKRTRATEEFREYQANEMLGCQDVGRFIFEFHNAALFTLISGKHWSLIRLANSLHNGMKVCVAPRGSILADRVSQKGLAIVLDAELLESRFRISLPNLINGLIETFSKNQPDKWHPRSTIDSLKRIKNNIVNLSSFAHLFEMEHVLLPEKELSKAEAVALQSLQYISYRLSKLCGSSARTIGAAKSDTAIAFTNGDDRIWVDRSLLRGEEGPSNGYAWANRACSILVHEYCHDFNSGVGHTHDAEFYEAFHNVIVNPSFGRACIDMFSYYVKYMEKVAAKFPASTISQLNNSVKNERGQQRMGEL